MHRLADLPGVAQSGGGFFLSRRETRIGIAHVDGERGQRFHCIVQVAQRLLVLRTQVEQSFQVVRAGRPPAVVDQQPLDRKSVV